MKMQTGMSDDGKKLIISIDGKFDFNTHAMFRESYKELPLGLNECQVDLRKTTYLDSSALGMLLLLREHFGDGVPIKIVTLNNNIREVLDIANFGQIFDLN